MPADKAFLRGFISTGTNPKVGLFLVAFLPQFVPAGSATAPALAVMAVVFLGIGLLWLVTWTNAVHRLSRFMLAPHVRRSADALVSVVFMAFAVRLLFSA